MVMAWPWDCIVLALTSSPPQNLPSDLLLTGLRPS